SHRHEATRLHQNERAGRVAGCAAEASSGESGRRSGAAIESGRRRSSRRPGPLMSYSGDRLLLGSQREGQISHFRGWVMVVVPVAAVAFQFYVPLFFQFLKFLEMPLLVVVYFALMRRTQISGLMIGAVVGLAQDSVFHNPLGMLGIDKTL